MTNFCKKWLTNETPPRVINVQGRSTWDINNLVGKCGDKSVLIYPTGFVPSLGKNVFALPEDGGDACPVAEQQAELKRMGYMK